MLQPCCVTRSLNSVVNRLTGTKTVEYCAQQASNGMINVSSKKCRTEGCGKQPSYGVAGTKTVEYCEQHSPDGMINVYNRKCRTEGCGKVSSLGVTGTKSAEYCARHTHQTGWSTLKAESAEPKAAASNHHMEWQVQTLWSTVHSTHRDGRHLQQKVQNRRLRKGALVWS